MEFKVFTVYDMAVKAYMPPKFFRDKGEVLRQFIDAANDPETPFYKHPGDYILFELGTFDDQTGTFTSLLVPDRIGVAIEYKKVDQPPVLK